VSFDVRLHPQGLTDKDLESLRIFGVTHVLIAPTLEPGVDAKGILAHFDELLGAQLSRVRRQGLTAFVCLGIAAPSVPRRGLQEVLAALPGYLSQAPVKALGAVGLVKRAKAELPTGATDANEEAMLEQLKLARRFSLKVLATVPGAAKEAVTKTTLSLLRKSGVNPAQVLVDGVSERTVRAVREFGFYAGVNLHPDHVRAEDAAKLVKSLGPERLVLASAAGEGACDLLSLPRAAHLMEKAGLSTKVVAKVTLENASSWLGIG
jgi:predicted metal-dependent TIM-barrel fold hydrolase